MNVTSTAMERGEQWMWLALGPSWYHQWHPSQTRHPNKSDYTLSYLRHALDSECQASNSYPWKWFQSKNDSHIGYLLNVNVYQFKDDNVWTTDCLQCYRRCLFFCSGGKSVRRTFPKNCSSTYIWWRRFVATVQSGKWPADTRNTWPDRTWGNQRSIRGPLNNSTRDNGSHRKCHTKYST